MLEVEVLGMGPATDAITREEVEWLTDIALASAGLRDAHLAVEFVDGDHIADLNSEFRSKDEPTDVLSFPVDEDDLTISGPRELGDIVICPEHTEDLREAVVHGVLHLLGMDHETDKGEMLALQRQILSWAS